MIFWLSKIVYRLRDSDKLKKFLLLNCNRMWTKMNAKEPVGLLVLIIMIWRMHVPWQRTKRWKIMELLIPSPKGLSHHIHLHQSCRKPESNSSDFYNANLTISVFQNLVDVLRRIIELDWINIFIFIFIYMYIYVCIYSSTSHCCHNSWSSFY